MKKHQFIILIISILTIALSIALNGRYQQVDIRKVTATDSRSYDSAVFFDTWTGELKK